MEYFTVENESVHHTNGDAKLSENFTVKELACPMIKLVRLHTGFIGHLQELRTWTKLPFRVNSCCRSIEHNNRVGGHPRSLHLTGNPYHPTVGTMAIDINVSGWYVYNLNNLLNVAESKGWSIGKGWLTSDWSAYKISGFIHLDRRVDIGLPRTNFSYPWTVKLKNSVDKTNGNT